MSSWDRASSAFDGFASMLNDWHGATRGALGETNFDIYGNIQHNNRMKRDRDYANAFNSLNGPASSLDLQTQTLMRAYDLVGQDYIDRKVRQRKLERDAWETWGNNYSAQDMYHEMELGMANTEPLPINEKYDPWESSLIDSAGPSRPSIPSKPSTPITPAPSNPVPSSPASSAPVSSEPISSGPSGPGTLDWEAIMNTKTGIAALDDIDIGPNDDFTTLEELRNWNLRAFGRDLTEDQIAAWHRNH